jgi:diaminopimelate decarboxylase
MPPELTAPELPARVHAALAGADRPVCAYVYDTAAAPAHTARVRAALPLNTTVLYAVKANGHPAVVAAFAAAADGLEVASGGELAVAVAAGVSRIVFGGPAKTDTELAAAVTAGAQVNVESGHELRRLDLAAAAAGRRIDVAIRVNRAGPAAARSGLAGSHTMAGAATPFGVDEAQLPGVLALAARLHHVRVTGFHLHAVSNNLDAGAHARFITDAVTWSVTTAARHRIPLHLINVGGGFGVDHTSQATLDLGALRGALTGLRVPPGTDLIVEPGRILAADTGWYAAQVIDLKTTHGRTFAVLRGGTHHFRLPAAWGYDHPFTVLRDDDWPYPFDRPQVSGPVDAVGELCTPRDVLCRGQHVDRLRIGDVLVFGRTGAYGYDISHHDFLRHPPPQIIVL